MRPEPRMLAEVRFMKARTSRIFEESHGTGRKRIGTHQLANTLCRRSILIHRPHIQCQTAALWLCTVRGEYRVAEHKAADDVGPPRYGLHRKRLHASTD